MGGQRPRARKRHRARGSRRERRRDRRVRSARIDPRRVERSCRLRHTAPSHARRDREDGDPADAAADELEQAGGGSDPGAVSADPLQQDEEVRYPRRRTGIALLGRSVVELARFQLGPVTLTARARSVARLTGLALWRGFLGFYRSDNLTYAASIAYYALLSLF